MDIRRYHPRRPLRQATLLLGTSGLMAVGGVCVPQRTSSPNPPSALADSGLLVVLNKRSASASLVNAGSGATVATLPTGVGPHEVAVARSGSWAVVADYEGVPGTGGGNTLTVLDLRARTVRATIPLDAYRRPHGIAILPDDRHVVVTSEANQAVVVVDVEQRKVDYAVPTGERGTHLLVLAPDGRHVYTSNLGSGSVSLLDLETRAVVKTVATGANTEAIDLSPDGRELWVGNNATSRITVLDARTLDSIASFSSGGRTPIRLKFTPDGRQVLVSNMNSGDLRLFDARTRREVGLIPMPLQPGTRDPTPGEADAGSARPIGILMHPSGAFAWVAAAGRDEVAEVHLGERRVTRFLKAGTNPDGLGYARSAGR